MSDKVEAKISLDPIQSDAVAKTEDVVRRIQREAERFQRYVQKKSQRFGREISAVNQKLGAALAKSLGLETMPSGWAAWVRPDGTAELVLKGADPRAAKASPAAQADDRDHLDPRENDPAVNFAKPAPTEDAGKILPMPVGAANGSDHGGPK